MNTYCPRCRKLTGSYNDAIYTRDKRTIRIICKDCRVVKHQSVFYN